MTGTELSETPLKARHLADGARMGPFSGWTMPIQYNSGIIREHHHTRTAVSVFDTCHMTEFRVSGTNAGLLLDPLFARGVEDQREGTCRYNFLMKDQGSVRDDVIIYRLDKDVFLIVGNAGCRESDLRWIKESLEPSVKVSDETLATGKIDLQGPWSARVLNGCGVELKALPGYFNWTSVTMGDHSVLLSRTGYTGELGFEIYLPWEATPALWDFLLDQPDVKPAGLGARDTLRLEAGLPLYGQDMDETTTPVEAGFANMLDLSRDFIGRSVLKEPPRKTLVGIRLDGRRAARHGMPVFAEDGARIGEITSGCFAPSLGYAVAMGYVDSATKAFSKTPLWINARDGGLTGRITELPFYRKGTARSKLS